MGTTESKGKEDFGNLQVTGVNFSWKIENFSNIYIYTSYKSPKFAISTTSYYLELEKKSDINVRLHSIDPPPNQSRLQCKISVIDRDKHQRLSEIKRITISKETDAEVILKFNPLSSERKKAFIFPDDILTIELEVTILNNADYETPQSSASFLLETLSNDLEKFYHGGTDSDFTLKSGGKSFAVHRAILSCRSAVFAAMFRHDTLDTQYKNVSIEDIKPSTLNDLLYYMYTGKVCELTAEAANSMYRAADKYELPELKNVCLQVIQESLSANNVSDAAILADTFDEATLKLAVEHFIGKNLEDVLENVHWKAFIMIQPLLANALLANAFRTCKRN